jgi:hypothetical protein
MKRSSPLVLCLLLTASCAPDESGGQPAAASAIDRWVAAHPSDWTVRPSWAAPCEENGPEVLSLNYKAAGADILLTFACPLDAPTTESLRQACRFAVLQSLPHGIAVPGWEFEVLTPTSSITEGVQIVDYRDGRLRLTIEAPLFAVRGHDEREACRPPADGTTPPGCMVERQLTIPLRLALSAPFDRARAR